jgi:hypothetical protein
MYDIDPVKRDIVTKIGNVNGAITLTIQALAIKALFKMYVLNCDLAIVYLVDCFDHKNHFIFLQF